jgi:hypothetical protein
LKGVNCRSADHAYYMLLLFLGYPDRLSRPVAGVGGDRRRRGALQAGGAPHPRQPGAHGGLAPLQGERLRQEQGQTELIKVQ